MGSEKCSDDEEWVFSKGCAGSRRFVSSEKCSDDEEWVFSKGCAGSRRCAGSERYAGVMQAIIYAGGCWYGEGMARVRIAGSIG